MKGQKKNKVPAAVEAETAVSPVVEASANQESVAADTPTAVESENKVKGEKGKGKKKDNKGKKDKKK